MLYKPHEQYCNTVVCYLCIMNPRETGIKINRANFVHARGHGGPPVDFHPPSSCLAQRREANGIEQFLTVPPLAGQNWVLEMHEALARKPWSRI